MNLISIRDLAKDQGVSYEAIRRQVVKYSEDLRGHIVIQDGKQFLDESAVEYLKERRRSSPIVLVNQTQGEEIERLKEQIETLKTQLINAQDRIIALQDENKTAIESKTKYDLLLTEQTQTAEQLKRSGEEIENLRDQLAAANKEASSYKRTIFGLYKKIE